MSRDAGQVVNEMVTRQLGEEIPHSRHYPRFSWISFDAMNLVGRIDSGGDIGPLEEEGMPRFDHYIGFCISISGK